MRGFLRFLRVEHSDAIRKARQYAWAPETACYYRGQAAGYRAAAIGIVALIRRAERQEKVA